MFIIACFFLFVGLKISSGKNQMKYPIRVECNELVKQVENSDDGIENFHEYAH
jgi:hypothetical protein